MPGHVKKGGKQEQDPDPSPWLLVSFEMKKEDALKPYDPKKSVWVPDGEGGFDEAMIDLWMETRSMSRLAGSRRLSRRTKPCKSTRPKWRVLMTYPT